MTASTSGWSMTGIDTNTAVGFSATGPAVNSGTIDTTTDNNNSVFFENKYLGTSPYSTWPTEFGSNPAGNTATYATPGNAEKN